MADLAVRETFRREPRDLELLGGEDVLERGALAASLSGPTFAGGAQLGAGSLGPCVRSDQLQGLARGAQARPAFDRATLPP